MELDLYDNRLTEMEGLAGLAKLTKLSLGKNSIRRIAGIQGLAALHSLDLHSNLICTPLLLMLLLVCHALRSPINFQPPWKDSATCGSCAASMFRGITSRVWTALGICALCKKSTLGETAFVNWSFKFHKLLVLPLRSLTLRRVWT